MKAWPLLFLFSALFCQKAAGRPFDFAIRGVFKSIGFYRGYRQAGIFARDSQLGTEQRLRVGVEITKGVFHFDAASEMSLVYEQENPSPYPLPRVHPASAWDTESTLIDSSTLDLFNRFERLWVGLKFRNVDVILGKQVVATGVGKLFQAVSQVPRRAFVIADPEFPLTEDAATLQWRGPVTWEARFLPKTATQSGHNFHLRAKSNMDGLDVAMTAGRSDDKVFVGFEAAGNLGDSLLRGEIVGYHGERAEWVQALIGLDQAHGADWTSQIELFYNGFGKESEYRWTDTLHRSTPYRGLWYLGAAVSWQARHNVRLTAAPIFNLIDTSTLVHVLLNYSISENTEFLFGQFFSVSLKPGSEFGSQYALGSPAPPSATLGAPDLTYLLLKWYF